jgi:hypothetical protein
MIALPSLHTCREGWSPDFVGGSGWVSKFLFVKFVFFVPFVVKKI